MRKSVIAGNWKMHMTCAEAKSYLEEFIPLIKDIKDDRKIVIAPPFTLTEPDLIKIFASPPEETKFFHFKN